MKFLVITNNQSYLIHEEDLKLVELGSAIFDLEKEKMYLLLEPGILTEVAEALTVETLEALVEAVAAGGNISIAADIDAPTGFAITTDTTITNNAIISIKEDTVGDGVFMVTEGTLTLNGNGIIDSIGKNDWNMALWAKDNGKIIINNGFFTNVGATANVDP